MWVATWNADTHLQKSDTRAHCHYLRKAEVLRRRSNLHRITPRQPQGMTPNRQLCNHT